MATTTKTSKSKSISSASKPKSTVSTNQAASAKAQSDKIKAATGLSLKSVAAGSPTHATSSSRPTGGLSEATHIDKTTNEIVGSKTGTVYGKGSSLSEALAKQTQIQSGGTPTVFGRPDLYGTTPLSSEGQSFFDKSTQTTVTPKTATPEQLNQVNAGTLESFNKAQGLTYLDMPTFKELKPLLNESDLIRGPNGQISLKAGLTPDQVRSRAETAVTGTTTGVSGDTTATDFTVDVPDAITTDTIDELMNTPVTETDFNTMLSEIQAKQAELLTLMVPGADEQATKAQINDIKAQVEKTLTELSMGLNNVEDQPIAMQFITGQQASIQRNADAKLQNLARIEENLLNELGLEQEARQVKASVAQTQLGYLQTNLDLAFKVKEMLQQEEDRVFSRSQALKTDAQSKLAMILDTMQGLNEDDLTPDQQKQLQDLATSSGIPYSLITAGMANVKNQMLYKNASTGLPGSVYTKEQLDVINTVSDDMRSDDNIKNYLAIKTGYQRVEDGVTLDSGQGDLAIVYGYMKMLDPNSVVREGEFATAENTSGVSEALRAKYNNLLNGGRLSESTRSEFATAAGQLYKTADSNYQNSYNYYANRVRNAGLNPSDVLMDLSYDGSNDSGGFIPIDSSYQDINSLISAHPEVQPAINALEAQGYSSDQILQFIEATGGVGFSNVGADTQQGAKILNKVLAYDDGSKGGQCGHFVNVNAGTHMGDSYASKMAYVNVPNTKAPSPGDIFVTPYKDTGHTGFVLGSTRLPDGSYDVSVMDSNWKLDERVHYHTINSKKISGYARLS